jgi:hypothetical protein
MQATCVLCHDTVDFGVLFLRSNLLRTYQKSTGASFFIPARTHITPKLLNSFSPRGTPGGSPWDDVTIRHCHNPHPHPSFQLSNFWGILSIFLGQKSIFHPRNALRIPPEASMHDLVQAFWSAPLPSSPSLSSHISHSSLSSTMAEALLPPAPVLVLLPSNHAIVLAANNNIALCILWDVMLTRAHILPTGKWADLERLLFDPQPPTRGPFHGHFRCWTDSQLYKKRGTKDMM